MLYLFAGDDSKNKYLEYEKFLKSVKPGTETFFISKNNFNRAELENFYSGETLFFKKSVVALSGIMESEEVRGFILGILKPLNASGNDFIFLEGKLNKPVLDAFKKAKGTVHVFELPKEKKEKFNSFLLANALGQRDKLNLWIYYRQAVDRGVALEELVGVLSWKAKDMLLKNYLGRFSAEELRSFHREISYLLPEARQKGRDPEVDMEQFLLQAF